MENQDFAIPKYIDEPQQILWWDMDEVAIAASLSVLGMISGLFIAGTALGIAASVLLAKLKHGKPRGFLRHAAYNNGYMEIKGCPPSHIKEFME